MKILDIYASIEEQWTTRATAQGVNTKTKAGRKRQCEFFAGAMAALVASGRPNGEAMPAFWVMPLLMGKAVACNTKEKISSKK